jgi:hypothetical protein
VVASTCPTSQINHASFSITRTFIMAIVRPSTACSNQHLIIDYMVSFYLIGAVSKLEGGLFQPRLKRVHTLSHPNDGMSDFLFKKKRKTKQQTSSPQDLRLVEMLSKHLSLPSIAARFEKTKQTHTHTTRT